MAGALSPTPACRETHMAEVHQVLNHTNDRLRDLETRIIEMFPELSVRPEVDKDVHAQVDPAQDIPAFFSICQDTIRESNRLITACNAMLDCIQL